MDAHTDAESIAADSRAALVERVNRQSATVGAKTPETITVNGTEVTLHAFLIEPRNLPDFCWVPRDSCRQRNTGSQPNTRPASNDSKPIQNQ